MRSLYSIVLAGSLLGVATASMAGSGLEKRIDSVEKDVIAWRRHFHEHPELSNREFETSKYIVEQLKAIGLKPVTGLAHTGVVAFLEGGKKGPTVALRADMDALPVTEQTGLPFASKAKTIYNDQEVGVMHACGHDAHMSVLLGVAKTLVGMKDQLKGNVLFIFQPAEEGAPRGEEGGAELMLKQGLFDEYKPEVVFGLHVVSSMPAGVIGLRSGPFMAAVDTFLVNIKGRQTHGSRPWGGVDPIVTSAQIINNLQTIVSRNVDITKVPAVVTVGKISGGIRHNIIPDDVEMWGTIRTFDPEMRKKIHKRIDEIVRLTGESAGAEATVEFDYGYPVTFNDPALYRKMLPSLEKTSAGNKVVTTSLITGAEDFSYFAREIPGLFFFVGAVPVGKDPATYPSNHSPFFDTDESALKVGVRSLIQLTLDYQEMH